VTVTQRPTISIHTLNLPGVRIEPFDGLLVDFVRAQGADLVLRGLARLAEGCC
jgi:phosphopantetheine adenylyltransferase